MSRFLPSSQVSAKDRARLANWRGRALATARIAAGCLWAVSAWLTGQPAAISALQHSLARASQNSALLASPWLSFWFHVAIANPGGFSLGVAFLEGCIALGLLAGMLTNLTCGMGIALALLGWSTSGLALIAPAGLSALAGDPGIALVCILACIGLSLSGAGQFAGLDSRLCARLGHWTFLASGWSQHTATHTGGQTAVWQSIEQSNRRSARYPALSQTGRTDRREQGRVQRQTVAREQVVSSHKRG